MELVSHDEMKDIVFISSFQWTVVMSMQASGVGSLVLSVHKDDPKKQPGGEGNIEMTVNGYSLRHSNADQRVEVAMLTVPGLRGGQKRCSKAECENGWFNIFVCFCGRCGATRGLPDSRFRCPGHNNAGRLKKAVVRLIAQHPRLQHPFLKLQQGWEWTGNADVICEWLNSEVTKPEEKGWLTLLCRSSRVRAGFRGDLIER